MNTSSGASTIVNKIRQLVKKHETRKDEKSKASSIEPGLAAASSETPSTVNRTSDPATVPWPLKDTAKIEPPYAPVSRTGQNLFLSLPAELISHIALELGKLPQEVPAVTREEPNAARILPLKLNLNNSNSIRNVTSRNDVLNFGLTCQRHLGIVLPEVHRNVELDFPLNSRFVNKLEYIKKVGIYTKTLGFRMNIDHGRSPRPPFVFELFPNITNLKLSLKFIDARDALDLLETALSLFSKLKALTVTGRIATHSLSDLRSGADYVVRNASTVSLESLRVHFVGIGSATFLKQLTTILQSSCRGLKRLMYRPFDHLQGGVLNNGDFVPVGHLSWGEIGYAMRSDKLEDLRVNIPGGQSEAFMKFIEQIPDGRRDRVKVLAFYLKEAREEIIDVGPTIESQVVRFPNLEHLRINHFNGRKVTTAEERKLADDYMDRMFESIAASLPNLKYLEWDALAFGENASWKWRKEDGKPWDKDALIKYPKYW